MAASVFLGTRSHCPLDLLIESATSSSLRRRIEKHRRRLFLDLFRGMPGLRDQRGRRHDLLAILAASIAVILAGAMSFWGIVDQLADEQAMSRR